MAIALNFNLKNCRGSHYNASFLFWIWINLTMINFYTSLVLYSKFGQLYKLVLGFGKRVTLQLRRLHFLKKLISLWETKDRWVICRIQSSIFEYFLLEQHYHYFLNVKVSSFSNAINPLSWSLFILWFIVAALNIQSKELVTE